MHRFAAGMPCTSLAYDKTCANDQKNESFAQQEAERQSSARLMAGPNVDMHGNLDWRPEDFAGDVLEDLELTLMRK